jgi:hypothetical protein
MPQLVGSAENPPLHRDPLPSVHDDGRATVLRGNGEAKEALGEHLGAIHLHAVVFEQTANVANGRVLGQAQLLARLSRELFHARKRPPTTRKRLEAVLHAIPHELLQLVVVVQPPRDVREHLPPSRHLLRRAKAHGVERAHGHEQLRNLDAKRLGHREQGAGTRLRLACLQGTVRLAGEPRLFGHGNLGKSQNRAKANEILGKHAGGHRAS